VYALRVFRFPRRPMVRTGSLDGSERRAPWTAGGPGTPPLLPFAESRGYSAINDGRSGLQLAARPGVIGRDDTTRDVDHVFVGQLRDDRLSSISAHSPWRAPTWMSYICRAI